MDRIPTVGRIVHYCSHGSPVLEDGTQKYKPEIRAAIITGVKRLEFEMSYSLSLYVITPTGTFFDLDVPMAPNDTEYTAGHWSWPPLSPLAL